MVRNARRYLFAGLFIGQHLTAIPRLSFVPLVLQIASSSDLLAVLYHGPASGPGKSGYRLSYETRLFVQKEVYILGSQNTVPEDFRAVIHFSKREKFPVNQAVSLVVPLERAADALWLWSQNPASFKKIMVSVD